MKKAFVLTALFAIPIVAYLFFASGVNNFGRLPVLHSEVLDIAQYDEEIRFEGHITILAFLGRRVDGRKGYVFNLNQKIYKRFREFDDFQIVVVQPEGTEEDVVALKKEIGKLADPSGWRFAFLEPEAVKALHASLATPDVLDGDLATTQVYIIDKQGRLRGRTDDEDEGVKYGFDTASVADLKNKMEDDVKVILAEYRLARRENDAYRNQD